MENSIENNEEEEEEEGEEEENEQEQKQKHIEEKKNPKLSKSETSRFNNNYATKRTNHYYKDYQKMDQNSLSVGERMYFQYRDQLPKKEAMKKKLEEERMEEESKELIFHPKISKRSRELAGKSNEKIEDRLLELGMAQKQKKIRDISQKAIMEGAKTPYHPTLPEKSKILGDIKRRIRLEEIPTNLKGINPEYVQMSRNKSSDVLLSNIGIENHTDSDEEYHLTPKNERGRKFSLLDEISSKYSFSNMKIGGSNISSIPNNRSTTNPNSSGMRSTKGKTSMIYHRKIPKPVLKPEKSIHDYLYLEAKIIDEKKQRESNKKMKEVCPFKPHIPQSVRNLLKNRNETTSEFIARMAKTKKDNQEIKIITNNPHARDQKTGQILFKPAITRGPKNKNKREVSVNLDSYYDKKLLKNKDEIQSNEICNNLEKKKIFLERSMEIIMKMKFERYKEIFNLLDSDHDGLISSNKIKLSTLDQDLLEAMTPLLEDLQESNETMSFKQFCLKVDKLLSVKIFADK